MKVHGVFHSLLLVLTLGLRSFAQDDHGSTTALYPPRTALERAQINAGLA